MPLVIHQAFVDNVLTATETADLGHPQRAAEIVEAGLRDAELATADGHDWGPTLASLYRKALAALTAGPRTAADAGADPATAPPDPLAQPV